MQESTPGDGLTPAEQIVRAQLYSEQRPLEVETMDDIAHIPGLQYIQAYLDLAAQQQFIHTIDQQPWLTDLKRRVQHYGYRYDYTRRSVDYSQFLGPLPTWGAQLAERLYHDGYTSARPDQLIVNEYQPGQGIARHIDCVPCFGGTILSISLGSTCVMELTHTQSRERLSILLEPGSLLIMQDEARYRWKHGIPPRKLDVYRGQPWVRQRRVSLTFRTIIPT